MNWVIRTLGRALVAGVGWKLGTEAYDFVKAKLKPNKDATGDETADGAGAATARVVPNGEGGPPEDGPPETPPVRNRQQKE